MAQSKAPSGIWEEEFDTLRFIAEGSAFTGDRFKYSHRLVAVSPYTDLSGFTLTPASKMIAREWTAFKLSYTMTEVNSLLGRVSGARLGLAYEPLAEDVLHKGGQFVMKQLI
jgi:hypothetical protein